MFYILIFETIENSGEKMKSYLKWFLAFVCLLILTMCQTQQTFTGKFKIDPQNAKPGDEITVYYNPDSTNLAGKKNIECTAYFYNSDLINTVDVPLEQKNNFWQGSLKINNEAYGIIFNFKSDEEKDNNNKSGYVVYLKNTKDENIPGCIAGYAAAINRWGAYYLDLDRDREKALSLFEKEFAKNQQVKEQFLNSYFEVVSSVEPEKENEIIDSDLKQLENKSSLNEKELELLTTWYGKIGNEKKSDEYSKKLNDQFPQNKLAQANFYQKFRNEQDVNKRLQMLKEFEKRFPESEYTQTLYDLIANSYRDKGNYNEAYNFLEKNQWYLKNSDF